MALNPQRASVPIFGALLLVEVIRQHSFWTTILGDSWTNQLVAIGSAAAMSAAQWMMAHLMTRTLRDLITTSYTKRQFTSRLLTIVCPLAISWLLVVAAVTTLTTADIAIRLHESKKATQLLLSTGLSEESAAILLAIWSTLVTLALIAALTAIGIHTADSAEEHQADADRERQLELDRLLADRNHYQDLYNAVIRTPAPGSPESSSQSNGPSNAVDNQSKPPSKANPGLAQPGSEPPSNGPSNAPTPQSNEASNPGDEVPEATLNLACPHCPWQTGPRERRRAHLALNGHLAVHRRRQPKSK